MTITRPALDPDAAARVATFGVVAPMRQRPTSEAHAATVLYFHGGGMVLGSNHSFEPLARMLAAASAATVVSVDYRLAPEHPAPAQFDDAYTTTTWVADNAETLGVDPARLAVAGDSAGGSLAAAVTLAARTTTGPPSARKC